MTITSAIFYRSHWSVLIQCERGLHHSTTTRRKDHWQLSWKITAEKTLDNVFIFSSLNLVLLICLIQTVIICLFHRIVMRIRQDNARKVFSTQKILLSIITIHCCCSVTQSCPTLCNPIDCCLPGSSVHGILQARILERVAIPFSTGSSQPRDQTWVSCVASGFFTI